MKKNSKVNHSLSYKYNRSKSVNKDQSKYFSIISDASNTIKKNSRQINHSQITSNFGTPDKQRNSRLSKKASTPMNISFTKIALEILKPRINYKDSSNSKSKGKWTSLLINPNPISSINNLRRELFPQTITSYENCLMKMNSKKNNVEILRTDFKNEDPKSTCYPLLKILTRNIQTQNSKGTNYLNKSQVENKLFMQNKSNFHNNKLDKKNKNTRENLNKKSAEVNFADHLDQLMRNLNLVFTHKNKFHENLKLRKVNHANTNKLEKSRSKFTEKEKNIINNFREFHCIREKVL